MENTSEPFLRQYEAVIILHPDVNEADQKNFFKRNQDTIKQFNGSVNHIDTWGKRRLANPIEKVKLGTYFHTTFEAKPGCVAELERVMKIDERVLRYVHVRLDERVPLSKHVEKFHTVLADSLKREQEKEAKAQARRMAMSGGGGFGGDRQDRSDRPAGRGPREVNYGSKRGAPQIEDDGGDSSEEN